MDRPIIFSAPMVRALLEGRKTQTRRILKPQPVPFKVEGGSYCDVYLTQNECDPLPRVTLGRVITKQEVRFAPGDRLWVRENFMPRPGLGAIARPHYRADPEANRPEWRGLWKPSIHMPRWASRLTLLITAVKIERVQDISDEDAKAEGMVFVDHGLNRYGQQREGWHSDPGEARRGPDCCLGTARFAFGNLWVALHGAGAWAENPFVVAITFKVMKANIDAPEAREAA